MITIKHTRQQGTLIYGTHPNDHTGKMLFDCGFRPSENLPVDDDLGDPYWYKPHSRRRRSDSYKIELATTGLEAAGFEVVISIDDTTPAFGFSDLEAERNDRAAARIERNDERANRAEATADAIDASTTEVRLALNGTPVVVGHYSEKQHRKLLDRLWAKDEKAWRLAAAARTWREKVAATVRYQHYRVDIGVTRRRIDRLETRLRKIGREMDASQVSERYEAILAAEVVELVEEISYWMGVLALSPDKVWTEDDFAKGDFVNVGGPAWYEVVKVGKRDLWLPMLTGKDVPQVRTLGALDRRSRGLPETIALKYEHVRSRLSAEDVHLQFPEAFAAPLGQDDPPKRPSRKQRGVRLKHKPFEGGENWYFEIDGTRYRAYWDHPEGWEPSGPSLHPCAENLGTVRFFECVALISAPDIPTGDAPPVSGPIWYVDDVHNQVHALVQEFAKRKRRRDRDQGGVMTWFDDLAGAHSEEWFRDGFAPDAAATLACYYDDYARGEGRHAGWPTGARANPDNGLVIALICNSR